MEGNHPDDYLHSSIQDSFRSHILHLGQLYIQTRILRDPPLIGHHMIPSPINQQRKPQDWIVVECQSLDNVTYTEHYRLNSTRRNEKLLINAFNLDIASDDLRKPLGYIGKHLFANTSQIFIISLLIFVFVSRSQFFNLLAEDFVISTI